MKPPDKFGRMPKTARLKRKMTLRQMESLLGVSNCFLSQLENHHTHVSFETAIALSESYGLELTAMASVYMDCRGVRN